MSRSPSGIGSAIHLLVWGCLLALFAKALSTRLYDPDLWWHLAAGREMAARGALLKTDIFSHTLFGAEWINFEWLGEIVLFSLYRMGGFWGLYAAKIGLSVAAVQAVAAACWAAGARRYFLAWLGVIAFFLLRPRLYERLELATLILFPVLITLVLAARGGTPFWRRALPWAVFVLFVLWSNLHAGFIYGWGALAALNIGARWSRRDPAFIRAMNAALLAAPLGAMINPFGIRITSVFADHLAHFQRGMASIEEWAPPSVADAPLFWALFIVCGALSVTGFLKRRPAALFWTPAVLVFAVWGARAFRNVALFAPIALPFIAEAVAPALENLKSRSARWAGAAAAWIAALAALGPPVAAALPKEPVLWRLFPVKACEFIRENDLRGTMYNAYQFGGYIHWALGPERRVFMDGRYLFHGVIEEQARLIGALLRDPADPGWGRYLERRGVELAIVDYPDVSIPADVAGAAAPLSPVGVMFPRESWALVFWDDSALVFVKRTEAARALIAAREYRALRPYDLAHMQLLLGREIPAALARAELERSLAEAGPTFLGRTMAGFLED